MNAEAKHDTTRLNLNVRQGMLGAHIKGVLTAVALMSVLATTPCPGRTALWRRKRRGHLHHRYHHGRGYPGVVVNRTSRRRFLRRGLQSGG